MIRQDCSVIFVVAFLAASTQAAFVCSDGSTPSGSCVNGLCAVGFTCNTVNNLCCKASISCSDGSKPSGSCVNGLCAVGLTCNTVNNKQICCKQALTCDLGSAPYRNADATIRQCNSGCPTGYECNSNICCPTKALICSLAPTQGTKCTTATAATRYYFNSASNSCNPFTYNGCSGNSNNFKTNQECKSYCQVATCSAGEVAIGPCINKLCPPGSSCKSDQCCFRQ